MACCVLAAFLFGLLVRSWRKLRGKDPEPVPEIPKPVVRVDAPSAGSTTAPRVDEDQRDDALVGAR